MSEAPLDRRAQAEDRLLDTLLDDALDLLPPPDLTARVTARLRGELAPASVATSPRRWGALAAALLVGVLVGGLAGSFAGSFADWAAARREAPAPLAAQVVQGELLQRGGGESHERRAGDRFALRGGDILQTGASAAVVALDEVGRLRVASDAQVAVQRARAAEPPTATVQRGTAVWDDGVAEHQAAVGGVLALRAGSAESLRARMAALQARVDDLSRELLAARLPQGDLPRQVVVAPTPAASPEPSEPPALLQTPAFAPFLAAVDWRATGQAMRELPELSARLLTELRAGGAYPGELALRVQAHNSVLVQQASAAIRAGAPGRWLNAAFNHPLFVVNHAGAALAPTATPLRPEQRERLLRLAVAAGEAEAERQRSEPADALALGTAIADCRAREQFTAELLDALDPAQRDLLLPLACRDTTLDVVGTGVAWGGLGVALLVRDRAHFAEQVAQNLALRLRIEPAHQPALAELVARWSRALPDRVFDARVTALERAGVFSVAPLREMAPQQLDLLRTLLAELPCAPEQRVALRSLLAVFVPYRDGG